jgi:hypothetical protein
MQIKLFVHPLGFNSDLNYNINDIFPIETAVALEEFELKN